MKQSVPYGEVGTEADMGNLDPINLDELCLAVLADPHAVTSGR